mmetsp:Transcript_20521/g.68717  ORF Transcript_20521/g.68717 Transcript_20521/m.68717 type:complete len:224 (+) Transcript_20521:411-1082(+)
MDVQTEMFLEEIADRPAEVDADTQTDPFMDRPPTPLFIPKKTGIDRETQIFEGELFDFDFEVEPILQVIVGKTLEQSLMEVLEEEELKNMRAHQEEFDQIRAAELAEAQVTSARSFLTLRPLLTLDAEDGSCGSQACGGEAEACGAGEGEGGEREDSLKESGSQRVCSQIRGRCGVGSVWEHGGNWILLRPPGQRDRGQLHALAPWRGHVKVILSFSCCLPVC